VGGNNRNLPPQPTISRDALQQQQQQQQQRTTTTATRQQQQQQSNNNSNRSNSNWLKSTINFTATVGGAVDWVVGWCDLLLLFLFH